jgi:cytochrome c oxidase subunit 1
MLDETLGKIHFWMLFIGFHTTFLVQHKLGVECFDRIHAGRSMSASLSWRASTSPHCRDSARKPH